MGTPSVYNKRTKMTVHPQKVTKKSENLTCLLVDIRLTFVCMNEISSQAEFLLLCSPHFTLGEQAILTT